MYQACKGSKIMDSFDKLIKKLRVLGADEIKEIKKESILVRNGVDYTLYARVHDKIRKSEPFRHYYILNNKEMTVVVTSNINFTAVSGMSVPIKVYSSSCELILDEKVSNYELFEYVEDYFMIFATDKTVKLVYRQGEITKSINVLIILEPDDFEDVTVHIISSSRVIAEVQTYYGNVFYYVSHQEGKTKVQCVHRFDTSELDEFAKLNIPDAYYMYNRYEDIEFNKTFTEMVIEYNYSMEHRDEDNNKVKVINRIKESYMFSPEDDNWKIFKKRKKKSTNIISVVNYE